MGDYIDKLNLIPLKRGYSDPKENKRPQINWLDYKDNKFPREELENYKPSNIGIICGHSSSNLVIIDMDKVNEKDFMYINEMFKIEHPKLSNTYIVDSPNGYHYYYFIKLKTGEECPTRETQKISNYPKLLEHVDILGYGGYVVATMSEVGEGIIYEPFNDLEPLEITLEEFNQVKDFFIDSSITTKKSKKVETARRTEIDRLDDDSLRLLRLPFRDILNGDIDIKELSIETGVQEFLYWKFLFIEANVNGIEPVQLFPLLEKNQPEFDLKKTMSQLKHHLNDKPLTNDKLNEFFPNYINDSIAKLEDGDTELIYDIFHILPKRQLIRKNYLKRIKDKSGYGITELEKDYKDFMKEEKEQEAKRVSEIVYREVRDKFKIITLSDSKQIRLAQSSTYNDNITSLIKFISDKISEYEVDYIRTKANTLERIKDTTLFNRNDFFSDNWSICFKNCYYDIKDGEFKEYPERRPPFYNLPYSIDLDENKKPIEYTCDKFKNALKEWLSKQDVITVNELLEFIGYSLSTSTNHKIMFFIYGQRDTGKTTFTKILQNLMGEGNYSKTNIKRLSKNEFGLNSLEFKIGNIASEESRQMLKDVERLKMLTGNEDMVQGEVKGGDDFLFRVWAKFWFALNYLPTLYYSDDDALFSRMILIYFGKQFPKTARNFAKEIYDNEEEMKGILLECCRHAHELYERGFVNPKISENTKETYLYNSDDLYAFIKDHCKKGKDLTVHAETFRKEYNDFCYVNKRERISDKKITLRLKLKDIYKVKEGANKSNTNVYVGITWNESMKTKLEKKGSWGDLIGK